MKYIREQKNRIESIENTLKEYRKNRTAALEELLNQKVSDDIFVEIYHLEVFEDKKQKHLYQLIVDLRTATLIRKKEKVSIAKNIINLYQNQKYKECFEYMEKSKYPFLSLFDDVTVTDEERKNINQINSEFDAYSMIKRVNPLWLEIKKTVEEEPKLINKKQG